MEFITNPGKKCCNLKEGWYCIGMLNDNNEMDWGQILEYVGEGEWHNDYREVVYSIWDSFLRMPVSMDAADGYQLQN